jgi:hypothetical protein
VKRDSSLWRWAEREAAFFERIPEPKAVALVCVLALVVRLMVSAVSHGSNDINTWQRFALDVSHFGVLRTYVIEGKFNHPPLMGLYAAFVDKFTGSQLSFDFAFKLLPIFASTVTVFLVQRIGKLKLIWLLLFALNPADVLISAYHGNTDCVCVACSVASVFFADREEPWLSGLALGAAMNVKLIPVVLIAPLFLSLSFRQMWRFALALGLCALPFLPIFLGPWAEFKRNAIDYNSSVAKWGVGLVVSTFDGRLQSIQMPAHDLTVRVGKSLISGLSVAIGLLQWRYKMFTRAELCAIAYSCFLAFAPGFGVQYLVYPAAFLAASHARYGFRYIYLASGFAFLLYYGFWTGTWPAFSFFHRNFDERSVLFGFLAWLCLLGYLLSVGKRVVVRLWLAPVSEP